MSIDADRLFRKVRELAGGHLSQADVAEINAALGIGTHANTLESPEAFYAGVRRITGGLEQVQVDIIEKLLAAACEWSIGWLAYCLATAWREARLKPIEEIGKGRAKPYGKVNSTGKAPYGRGLVQLTWHANYERADSELGLNGTLVKDYDRALEPEIAVKILVRGMEEGWFTGKSLSTYIAPGHGTHGEFVQARRIINGTDRAELIATIADQFKDALIGGGWS